MNNSLITVGVILILGVIVMLFRVSRLVDVLRGTGSQRVDGSNKFNALMFPIFGVVMFSLFFWITEDSKKHYLPEASSVHGINIDHMFWTTMIIITFVFILTHVLLFAFPYLYQFKEGRKATFFPDNHKLELIWTVIPAIVLAVLVFTGYKVWTEVTSAPPQGHETLEIVGKQFNWIVRYPGSDGQLGKHNFRKIDDVNSLGMDMADEHSYDDFYPSEIHLQVGKPVQFKIRARDVLHSVFAFHFRQKMDAVPGMPTSFWFTPTKTTADMKAETGNPDFVYEIACTEVCGQGHFGMRFKIVVEEEEEFIKWKNSQKGFLASNPDYIEKVPAELQEKARKFLPASEVKVDSTAKVVVTAAAPVATASVAGL